MTKLLTVDQVAKYLSVSSEQVYRWIRAGILGAIKLPTGRIRLTEKHIEDFLSQEKA